MNCISYSKLSYSFSETYHMKKLRPIGNFFKTNLKNSGLYNTLALAYYLRSLEYIVKQYLPDNMSTHFQVASYDYGKLVIICNSAVWTNKLRFHTRHLSSCLVRHDEFNDLNEIKCRTEAVPTTMKRSLPKPKKISLENKELLLDTARQEGDPKLSLALKRLARNASK